jgi:hypothetical protein
MREHPRSTSSRRRLDGAAGRPPGPAACALAQISGLSAAERRAIGRIFGHGGLGREASYLDASGLLGLRARDFQWPEFDRWQRLFASRRQFPPLWERLTEIPSGSTMSELREVYREHKLFLLLHWLHGLEIARHEMAAAVGRYAKLGLRARVARQGVGRPCPACDPFEHRQVSGVAGEIPPFHPGCRCLILPIIREPARSGRRSA